MPTINFGRAIKFIVDNLDEFKEIFEDGSELVAKITQLFAEYQSLTDGGRVVMAGEKADELRQILDENSVLMRMALNSVEDVSTEEVTVMTGGGLALSILQFLVTYGPLIKQILDELRK